MSKDKIEICGKCGSKVQRRTSTKSLFWYSYCIASDVELTEKNVRTTKNYKAPTKELVEKIHFPRGRNTGGQGSRFGDTAYG